MKFNFKTLCSICCVLLYGSALADAGESKIIRKSSVGKFVQDIKETQQISSDRNKKTRELSPKWFAAAESGDLEEMKKLWDEAFKYNLYIRDDSQRTALEIAITKGYADMVEWLADRTEEQQKIDLASNFNLRSSNKDRKPMMIVAVENNHEDIVKIMLSRAMDPDIYRDESIEGMDRTPLIVAAECGHTGIVDLLLTRKGNPRLSRKANPNLGDMMQRTALMYASKGGHADIVKLLLDNEADSNKKDMWGDTALIFAASFNKESVVKLLLEHGADPNIKNKDKETALIWAAKQGCYNIAKMLLEKGAIIDTKDKEKKTALDYAKENEKMTKLLLEYVDRPENQKQEKNILKKAWNKVTKKNADDKNSLKNRRLSADSDATLYEGDTDTETGRDIDDVISSTDTLTDY